MVTITISTTSVHFVALVNVILLILSLTTPWYSLTSVTSNGQPCSGAASIYWFSTSLTCPPACLGCVFYQPLGVPLRSLCHTPEMCPHTYQILMVSFSFLLLGFCVFLAAFALYIFDWNIISAVMGIITIVFILVSVITFGAGFPGAIAAQVPAGYKCDGFSCAKLSGTVPANETSPATDFGPSSGWVVAIICCILTAVFSVLAFLCVGNYYYETGEWEKEENEV